MRAAWAVAALALAAQPSARPPATRPATPEGPRTVVIHVANFAFVPADTVLAVGDTVVWVNEDDFEHVVAADSLGWKSPTLAHAARYALVARRPGPIPYHCAAHPVMRGLLRVQ